MQKIKTKINSMRSEDLAIVGIRVVETIEKSVAEEVKNSLLFTQLIEVTNRFRKAIGPDDKEEKAVVTEKFNFRKQLFNNFYNFVFGLKQSKDPTVKAAATEVFSVLNMYGGKGFNKLSRSAHTQRYTTIVETLNQAEYTAAIAKLNVGDFLSELSEANTAYEASYQAIGNKRSMRMPSTDMRTEMNNALKAVTDEVKLYTLKYPTEANKALQNNVLQRIAEVYVPAPGSTKRMKTSTESTNQVSTTEVI